MSPDGPEASFQKADAKVGVLFETTKSFKVFLLSPSRTASLCEREEKERRKKPGAAHCKDVKKRTLYLSKAGAKIGKGRTTPKHKGNFFTQNEKLFRKGLGNSAMKGRGKKAKGKGDTLLYYKGDYIIRGGPRGRPGTATEEDREKKEGKGRKKGERHDNIKKTGERHKNQPHKKGATHAGPREFPTAGKGGEGGGSHRNSGKERRPERERHNTGTRQDDTRCSTKKNKKGRIKNRDKIRITNIIDIGI